MSTTEVEGSPPTAASLSAWPAGATGVVIVLVPFIALIALRPVLPDWALVWPKEWAVPFVDWINAAVGVLKNEPIFIWFTFKDFTRAIATVVEWPLDFLQALLISGFKPLGLPALPWVMVVGLAAVLGWWIKGWRLALLAGGCIFYIALIGKWKLSMTTLSVVLVAAPIACAVGLLLGIVAVKWRPFERMLMPILNVMQSLPHQTVNEGGLPADVGAESPASPAELPPRPQVTREPRRRDSLYVESSTRKTRWGGPSRCQAGGRRSE